MCARALVVVVTRSARWSCRPVAADQGLSVREIERLVQQALERAESGREAGQGEAGRATCAGSRRSCARRLAERRAEARAPRRAAAPS